MALPTFTMREMLEAGVHFGHHQRRWNPKMAPYLYGQRNKIHIIDLTQTMPLLYQALQALQQVAADGGRILFVGSKRQAAEGIADTAKKCGQYYINHRWLGGMLTNWRTVSRSINRLQELEKQTSQSDSPLTKKEMLTLQRQYQKLELTLGGIKSMGGAPALLFVIDSIKEATAIREARKLNIPVVAVIDSNSDPDGITYPIPGNDDARRAIGFYLRLALESVVSGLEKEVSGLDDSNQDNNTSRAPDLQEPGAASPKAVNDSQAKPASAVGTSNDTTAQGPSPAKAVVSSLKPENV